MSAQSDFGKCCQCDKAATTPSPIPSLPDLAMCDTHARKAEERLARAIFGDESVKRARAKAEAKENHQ